MQRRGEGKRRRRRSAATVANRVGRMAGPEQGAAVRPRPRDATRTLAWRTRPMKFVGGIQTAPPRSCWPRENGMLASAPRSDGTPRATLRQNATHSETSITRMARKSRLHKESCAYPAFSARLDAMCSILLRYPSRRSLGPTPSPAFSGRLPSWRSRSLLRFEFSRLCSRSARRRPRANERVRRLSDE